MINTLCVCIWTRKSSRDRERKIGSIYADIICLHLPILCIGKCTTGKHKSKIYKLIDDDLGTWLLSFITAALMKYIVNRLKVTEKRRFLHALNESSIKKEILQLIKRFAIHNKDYSCSKSDELKLEKVYYHWIMQALVLKRSNVWLSYMMHCERK